MLIINNTRVFPARITGTAMDGKVIDILLVREKCAGTWEVLSQGKFSGILKIADELIAELRQGTSARFQYSGNFMDLLWKYGNMPLPPNIRRSPDPSDKQTYQTVYAMTEGSIAAPTAGLHFTDPLLDAIAVKGVKIRELTLHVGVGTFRPVRAEMVEDHIMDMGYFEIPGSLIDEMEEAKTSGRRIVAVGTTTTRSLEGYFSGIYRNGSKIPPSPVPHTEAQGEGISSGKSDSEPIRGTTDIFIYPGHVFRAIDSLITNFHLPHSTPLMLVCALAGRENIFTAYHEAIRKGYRFLSYGDAMLIV